MKTTEKMINYAGTNCWKCWWEDQGVKGIMEVDGDIAFALLEHNAHTQTHTTPGETEYQFTPVAIFY